MATLCRAWCAPRGPRTSPPAGCRSSDHLEKSPSSTPRRVSTTWAHSWPGTWASPGCGSVGPRRRQLCCRPSSWSNSVSPFKSRQDWESEEERGPRVNETRSAVVQYLQGPVGLSQQQHGLVKVLDVRRVRLVSLHHDHVPAGHPGAGKLPRVQARVAVHASRHHSCPNHQRWYAKWKLRMCTYTLHTHFCTFGADLCAQSVLVSKNFCIGSISRKFIKSALLAWQESLAEGDATTCCSCAGGTIPNSVLPVACWRRCLAQVLPDPG